MNVNSRVFAAGVKVEVNWLVYAVEDLGKEGAVVVLLDDLEFSIGEYMVKPVG